MLAPLRADAAGADTARPRRAGAGAGLGAVTGFLGVGGGFLAVPALVSVLGLRMRGRGGHQPAGHHRQLPGRAGRTHRDRRRTCDWAVIGPFTGAAILGAWDGKRLAAKVSGQHPAADLRRACCWRWPAFMLIDVIA